MRIADIDPVGLFVAILGPGYEVRVDYAVDREVYEFVVSHGERRIMRAIGRHDLEDDYMAADLLSHVATDIKRAFDTSRLREGLRKEVAKYKASLHKEMVERELEAVSRVTGISDLMMGTAPVPSKWHDVPLMTTGTRPTPYVYPDGSFAGGYVTTTGTAGSAGTGFFGSSSTVTIIDDVPKAELTLEAIERAMAEISKSKPLKWDGESDVELSDAEWDIWG